MNEPVRVPAPLTGHLRLDFQIEAVKEHSTGLVLNVGANEDPAALRKRFGDRVVNCDIEAWDSYMNRPNDVQRVFNALHEWPCNDDEAELVVFGDILEHFTREEIRFAISEARRVAPKVAVSVPIDTRIDEAVEIPKHDREHYNLHTTIVTPDLFAAICDDLDLEIVWFLAGEWLFDNIQGLCLLAETRL